MNYWFTHFSVVYEDDGSGLRFTDYMAVLQAAVAGEGIALCLAPSANTLIDQRQLPRAGELS